MEEDHRRGPWTVEEDLVLVKFVTGHGEGRWNALARCAGLKRTGKSCRLRWLNYLRPDVRRGNITPDEQLLILELHSRWGNRWSKIARFLPGRTDNEIKNYWRTRVQKHAKQLGCDVNSKTFRDAMRHLWMPRLLEQARAAASACGAPPAASSCFFNPIATAADPPQPYSAGKQPVQAVAQWPAWTIAGSSSSTSSDSAPPAQLSPTLAPGCYPAAAVGMVKCDEEFVDMDGGWTSSSESLPACPMNYGEFEQLGGWASEDLLLSSEYLWNMEEEALDQSYIC